MTLRTAGRAPTAAAALAALAVLAPAACARQGAPRGGPEDLRAPVVIATDPLPLSTLEGEAADRGTVVFRFDERISENPSQGTLDEAVLISPATGNVRVEQGRDGLEVRLGGGFRPGFVYRVTLLPVIADLFGNTMPEPFELVFSTGAPFTEDAVAGVVVDRITGLPVQQASLQLLPAAPTPDTVVHVARSGAEGLFFFRFLPRGQYRLVAFEDRDRDGVVDAMETQGTRNVFVQEGDTLIVELPVLAPDTTAAELVRVEVEDSATLRLVFTDFLDPAEAGSAVIGLEAPEGRAAPSVESVLHPDVWQARQDSLAEAGDTAAARRDRGAPRPGQQLAVPGQERGGLPAGLPLPANELIVRLDGPLVPGVPYQLTAARIVNINRNPVGRGRSAVVREVPPPDSAAAPPDSAGVGGGAAPPDSAAAAGARPDTVGVR